MPISARVIEDSINQYNCRLTTLVVRHPRFVHADFMTHRLFSRNASSSRAIPIKRYIEMLLNDPAIPVHFGKNQKGMQAGEELTGLERDTAVTQWLNLRHHVLDTVDMLNGLGVHKQVVNRLMEPWQYIEVVVTATEWDNFLWLRDHEAAQPDIQVLASRMLDALNGSTPKRLHTGDWHLPFVQEEERKSYSIQDQLRFSVARCARVSYMTHEGKVDHDRDRVRHDELMRDGHVSPFEHQATTQAFVEGLAPKWSGNFLGYVQYRKMLKGEHRGNYPKLKKHIW